MKKSLKLIVVLGAVLLLVSLLAVVGFASDASNIAKIGGTEYATLADALKAAGNDDTIEIFDGTWDAAAVGTLTTGEAALVRYKSLTLQPAENAHPIFTSNVYIGYDDSSTANASITVKGLAFENASLSLVNYVNAKVENCTFSGAGNGSAVLYIADSCCKNHKTQDAYPASLVSVVNCQFNGTKAGTPAIRLRNSGNVEIKGNTVLNSAHNAILFESNGSVDNTPNKTILVTNNVIKEWNATNAEGGGRAIRAALGTLSADSTVTITANTFEKAVLGKDEPDFVKVTGTNGCAVVMNGNDWNGLSVTEVNGNSSIYTVDGAGASVTSVAVAAIGDTLYSSLADAIAAASDDVSTVIKLLADVNLGDYGATGVTVPAGKVIVFDLNGHQLSGNTSYASTSQLLLNKGTLTIKDSVGGGRILSGATPTWTYNDDYNYVGSYASNTVRNEGNLTVLSGKIENAGTGYACYCIDNYNAGNVNISGGALRSAFASCVRMFVSSGNVTVSGNASLTSVSRYGLQIMQGSANVEIAGGTFSGQYAVATYNCPNAVFAVSGGVFKNDFYAEAKTIIVTGGTFFGEVDLTADTLSVTGGAFSADVGEYCTSDYVTYKSGGFWYINLAEKKNEQQQVEEVVKTEDGAAVGENVVVISENEEGDKTKDQDAIEKVIKTVNENEAVNCFDNSMLEKATTKNDDTDAAQASLALVIDALRNAANEDAKSLITTAASLVLKVKVTVIRATVEETQESGYLVKKMTFDVTPTATTTVAMLAGSETVSTKIPNLALNEEISFRLPIDASVACGTIVKIYHEDTEVGTTLVEEENGEKYVEWKAKTFSSYSYEITEQNIGDTKYAATLSLKDNIDVNLYVKFPIGTETAEIAKYGISATFDGSDRAYNLAECVPYDEKDGYVRYKFIICSAFYYQMTDNVEIAVSYDGNVVKAFTYSVERYFIDTINMYQDTDADLVNLCKAALDYGANAQLFFSGRAYNGGTYPVYTNDKLANRTTNPDNTIAAVNPEKTATMTGSIDGCSQFTASLVLGSETSIKVRFAADDVSLLAVTCHQGGNEVAVSSPVLEDDGRYAVEISGIKSYELGKDFVLTLARDTETVSITYSAFAYASGCWNCGENLGNLAKALVNYGNTSAVYFE